MAKNKRYGIWNNVQKRFVFGIDEDSKNRAMRELQRKIGQNAHNSCYSVRTISQNWHNPKNPKYSTQKQKN